MLSQGPDLNVYQKYHDIESLGKDVVGVDMSVSYRTSVKTLHRPSFEEMMQQAALEKRPEDEDEPLDTE